MGMDIFGFDELDKKLQRLQNEFPEELEREIIRIALKLETKIKKRTPVGTGRLRASFEPGPIQRDGDKLIIDVGTNMEYAPYVEHGHKTTKGGFVPGVHMIELSIAEIEKELPENMQALFISVIKETGL